jgi:hypothetical protein
MLGCRGTAWERALGLKVVVGLAEVPGVVVLAGDLLAAVAQVREHGVASA